MKRTFSCMLLILSMLGGCLTPMWLAAGNASLCLVPRIKGEMTSQALVPIYSKSSINHLILKLFTLSGETENPMMIGESQITKDIPNSDLDFQVRFTNLRNNTTYRVRAYAYKAPGTNESDLISTSASYVDMKIGVDDRPAVGAISVLLADKPFYGQATGSFSVTPGGYSFSGPESLTARYFITSIAGNHLYGENVPATTVSLSYPSGVFADASGNLYISDEDNQRVRKVDAITGITTTIAGTGIPGNTGNGGQATSACFNSPHDVAVDAGNAYIADEWNHRIRKVDLSTGIIATVAGNGKSGYSTTDEGGLALNAPLLLPTGIVADALGNVYIADHYNKRIRKLD